MPVDIRGIEIALVKTIREMSRDSDVYTLSQANSGMVFWQTQRLGIVSNPNHVFTANTELDAEVLRDTYFTANPAELIQDIQCTVAYPLVDPVSYIQTYSTKPEVIRSRVYSEDSSSVTPTFPDYPYASVDYTRITDEGNELTQQYYNSDEDLVYQTHKLASYSIKVFGTSKDDVLGICNDLHMRLEIDHYRDMLRNLSPTEARLRGKTDITFVASAMQDKYREVASFDIILAVLDEVTIKSEFAPPILNVEMDTTTTIDSVRGGLCEDDVPNESLDIQVSTDITYP